MMRCVECGTDYAEELSACPDCSTPAELVLCGRCGETFQEEDACPACGQATVAFDCERHPERVARGRCVICGSSVCKECNRGEGLAYLCPEDAGVTVIQGWAQVYSTTSEFDAQLLRENLLAEGIDTQIFSQKDNMLSVDLGELSIVRILVPVWEYGQAQELISQRKDPRGEVAFACPACGEAYEPGSESCSSCGFELLGADR